MAKDKLTPKQELFVREYLIDLNATQAAIRAGYSKKNAEKIGYQLLEKTRVQQAIQNAMDKRSKRLDITADKVLQELAKIGFSNITDYLKVDDFEITVGYEKDEEGNPTTPIKRTVRDVEIFKTDDLPDNKVAAVAEIKRTRDGISLKLHDKVKALEDIGRHLKLFTDKIEHSGEIGVKKLEDFF